MIRLNIIDIYHSIIINIYINYNRALESTFFLLHNIIDLTIYIYEYIIVIYLN